MYMNKDINELSVQELKALAYDVLARIQSEQNNLAFINQMIEKKSSEPLLTPPEEPKTPVETGT